MKALDKEEVQILKNLLNKKIEGIDWVLENKEPKDPDKLKDRAKEYKTIIKKLES